MRRVWRNNFKSFYLTPECCQTERIRIFRAGSVYGSAEYDQSIHRRHGDVLFAISASPLLFHEEGAPPRYSIQFPAALVEQAGAVSWTRDRVTCSSKRMTPVHKI